MPQRQYIFFKELEVTEVKRITLAKLVNLGSHFIRSQDIVKSYYCNFYERFSKSSIQFYFVALKEGFFNETEYYYFIIYFVKQSKGVVKITSTHNCFETVFMVWHRVMKWQLQITLRPCFSVTISKICKISFFISKTFIFDILKNDYHLYIFIFFNFRWIKYIKQIT